MESLSFENFISLINVFVSGLLIAFLLTAKSKSKTSNTLLVLFLLVNAQDASGMLASYFVYPKFPGWGMIINSTVFFKMPLLFLYIQSIVYSDFKLKKIHLLHLIPWILNLLILMPRYFAVDFDAKWAFLNAIDYHNTIEIRTSYILVHIQILVYLIMSFILIKKYKTLLLENYSNANLFNHKWLFQLILLFAIEAFIASLKNAFMFLHLENAYKYTLMVTGLLALGFICWIVLKALHSPELFRGVNSNLQLVKNIAHEEHHISELDSPQSPEITALKKYMIEEKPYLNASLTIYDLSKEINMNVRDLSLLINHDLNQHFFDFVNEYRIEKAMEILRNSKQKQLTILEILYDVGFNSKSSFNTAFKKYIKLTPTQYRESVLGKIAS